MVFECEGGEVGGGDHRVKITVEPRAKRAVWDQWMGSSRIGNLARSVWRRVNRPMTALVCGVAMFVDVSTLPENSRFGQGWPPRLLTQGTNCYFGPLAMVIRRPDSGGVLLVSIDDLTPPSSTLLGHLTCGRRIGPSGWWAGVEYVDEIGTTFDWSQVTSTEAASIRQSFAELIDQNPRGYGELGDRFRTGDLMRSHPRPWGYVHNIISATVAAGFGVGLVASGRRVRTVMREVTETRDRQRLAHGECPRCGYDVSSMQALARDAQQSCIRCPECGAEYPL